MYQNNNNNNRRFIIGSVIKIRLKNLKLNRKPAFQSWLKRHNFMHVIDRSYPRESCRLESNCIVYNLLQSLTIEYLPFLHRRNNISELNNITT